MWKVEITFRNWVDICNITEIYYSDKNIYQDAISECINKFYREHYGSQGDIININATEEFM